jgi:chemotaxis protein histidine kinase CheA
MLDSLKGHLEIESANGVGSSFIFTLPIDTWITQTISPKYK